MNALGLIALGALLGIFGTLLTVCLMGTWCDKAVEESKGNSSLTTKRLK